MRLGMTVVYLEDKLQSVEEELNGLELTEAKEKLAFLRRYFELKKNAVGLERQMAQLRKEKPPGKGYQKRLAAYLQWAMLGLRIAKFQSSLIERREDNGRGSK